MSPRNRVWILLGAVLCLLPVTAVAATDDQQHPQSQPAASGAAVSEPFELSRSKKGSAPVAGRQLAYTATAGTLIVRDDLGNPTGSLFYVSYIAAGVRDPNRPVTFAFNGGPGTASLWLHLGGLGPVRLDFPNDRSGAGAPYPLMPSEDTILDRTDLVFIDMMGTGFSRPLGKSKPQDFWSVDTDIDTFARAIRRYLDLNGRWNSPKFILGESYGTLRAAGLVYALHREGIQINGLVLLSCMLDIETGMASDQDRYYVGYLPTYAATALYHGRVTPAPSDRDAFLDDVRHFASGPYLQALTKGDALPDEERNRIAAQLERYTGLAASYWVEARLRIDDFHFRAVLLRERHSIVGRIDARFTATSGDRLAAATDADPGEAALLPPYAAVINAYLHDTLGYPATLEYRSDIYAALGDSWDFRHRQAGQTQVSFGSVIADLAATLRENPHLKVLQLEGLYDMATPFYAAELTLSHLQIDPSLARNLRIARYPSGHMIYIEADSRHRLKADLARFYDEVLEERTAHQTSGSLRP